ncbi:MAG: RNA polymerase sigma factor [Aureispira sp.]
MLENPLNDDHYQPQTDALLVVEALNGSKPSLELLIKRHQPFIYNIVWKMVLNPQNAEDITQDILIKIITKLPQFQHKSQFRTWLYRIAVNHVLNVKKQFREVQFTDFDTVATVLQQLPDNDAPETIEDIKEDVKISCTAGMLLCLDRAQRIVFILGAIFNIKSQLGADILEISAVNFRKRLSRARKDLHNFMNDNCGLINKSNPCRCPKKTRAFIANGWTDPDDLQFNSRIITDLYKAVPKKNEVLLDIYEEKYQLLFSEHPLQRPLKEVEWVNNILKDKKIEQLFNLND